MKTIIAVIMVISGCLLVIIGVQLAHFFYEFPAIPGVLSVTFMGDTIAFVFVGVVGLALSAIGILRLVNNFRRKA
jgi:hypothetical protein